MINSVLNKCTKKTAYLTYIKTNKKHYKGNTRRTRKRRGTKTLYYTIAPKENKTKQQKTLNINKMIIHIHTLLS